MNEERTVHRLEAFSDIVIGFCLAELGTSLTFNIKTMTLDPVGVIAFFLAFAIVCSLWFFHHRLFEHLFVPRTWPIVLNFVWLAVVVLLVLTAVQVPRAFEYRNFDMLYFSLYSLAYGILSVQTILGLRIHADLTAGQRFRAITQFTYMTYWASVFVTCFFVVAFTETTVNTGIALDVIFALAGIMTPFIGVVLRRYKPAVSNA